ncbi:hypothetical protein NC981_21625 [Leptolyngbya sp. DQ-M1]|uniref:hypothetical protein n=1 Tax=Leptolyngbya sp. DQ-M1 TaxID=2933920 RepID=UPI00329786B9
MAKAKLPDPKRYLLPGGQWMDLTKATAFVRLEGRYYAIADCMISAPRTPEEIAAHYSDPQLDTIRQPEPVEDATIEESQAYVRPSSF